MYFFKFLALILGVLMITAGVVVFLLRERWTAFLFDKVMPEKQPFWLWPVAAVTVLIVAMTWYMELTTAVKFSWIITLLITVALPKMYFLLFKYQWIRGVLTPFMEKPRLFSLVWGLFAYAFGLIVLAVGMFSL